MGQVREQRSPPTPPYVAYAALRRTPGLRRAGPHLSDLAHQTLQNLLFLLSPFNQNGAEGEEGSHLGVPHKGSPMLLEVVALTLLVMLLLLVLALLLARSLHAQLKKLVRAHASQARPASTLPASAVGWQELLAH